MLFIGNGSGNSNLVGGTGSIQSNTVIGNNSFNTNAPLAAEREL